MDVALKAMMAELAPVIRDFVAETLVREVAPLKSANEELRERIATLENRAPEKGDQGEKGEAGENGVSPDPEAIAEAFSDRLKQMVEDAVSTLPSPEKGEAGEKGDRGESGEKGQAGENGKDGSDGRGIRDLLIDRDGQLVATMSDGEMKTLGSVVGKDGQDGKPGRDGFSLEDFDCEVVDERTINLKFVRGDTCHSYELVFPVPVYQGVYKEGVTYAAGDMVTWGGSAWSAKSETSAKPDAPDSGWQLCVKRGRDGKDFKLKDAA